VAFEPAGVAGVQGMLGWSHVSLKVSFEIALEAEGSSLRCLKPSGLGFSPLGLKAFPRDKIYLKRLR
jgi:hypothetical protein